MLLLETGVTVIAVLLALCWPRLGSRWFASAESLFQPLARRRRLSVITVGCSALLIRLAILPVIPIPEPQIHDEFSYLLAADTFASGRLTNPTHPMWKHLESFHISHQPTYMSMYFPGQGLVLAAGQALTGRPWYGVWLSAGLMCAAICWMLQGWLPPGWALFGGALAVVRLGVFSYWVNSYYGGAVAALGGALVLGALPRIQRAYRIRDGLVMATGVAILASTRPYEGLLVCAPAIVAALWAVIPRSGVLVKLLAPATLLITAAGLLGYYDYRVFGNPLTLPYELNRATYASAPVFLWQAARPEPQYRHAVMRDFYTNWELSYYREARTPMGFAKRTGSKAATSLVFVCGALFLPALVMLPWVIRDRHFHYLIAAAAIFALGLTVNAWLFPHYLAPFLAGFYAILLQCLRHLRAWKGSGRTLVRLMVVMCLVLAGLRLFAGPLHLPIERWPTMWSGTEPFGLAQAAVAAKLASYPGKQLAIVRYAPSHDAFVDWVYNAADIDRSHVVWAREMGPNENLDLTGYFRDRTAWLVEPDALPPRVTLWVQRPGAAGEEP
ncbi:MAG: hypothetical protein ABI693_27125 [Bryobacteraceae bacterium]